MPRYSVNGAWAPEVVPALLPSIPVTPVSTTWGWSNVTGHPGTKPIPSPKPGVHSVSPSVLNQPSWCSPDVFYPALYRSDPDVNWRHTPTRPQEVMPVPAVNLYNMAGVAMRMRKTGGRYQVAQPSVVQTWPDLLGQRLASLGAAASSPLPPRGA
jgi:hypothetical protein